MKGRTCILVTHHIRLCLPIAAMLVRMDGGRAELEEISEDELKNLPEVADGDDKTVTAATPNSKSQTTGVQTPMNGGLITKEHRDIVRCVACLYHTSNLLLVYRVPSSGQYTRCTYKQQALKRGLVFCQCC